MARASGIRVGDACRAKVLATMAGGKGHLPSMARDVQAGRTTEITQLNKQISRRGRELRIPTPTQDALLDLIRTFD